MCSERDWHEYSAAGMRCHTSFMSKFPPWSCLRTQYAYEEGVAVIEAIVEVCNS